MPGFIVTRGFGPGATPSSLIVRGFVAKAVQQVIRIIRGGGSAGKRFIRELEETFKISAMLVVSNGKQFAKPIVNTINKSFKGNKTVEVKILPLKLVARRSDNLKVTAAHVKVRKNKDAKD